MAASASAVCTIEDRLHGGLTGPHHLTIEIEERERERGFTGMQIIQHGKQKSIVALYNQKFTAYKGCGAILQTKGMVGKGWFWLFLIKITNSQPKPNKPNLHACYSNKDCLASRTVSYFYRQAKVALLLATHSGRHLKALKALKALSDH